MEEGQLDDTLRTMDFGLDIEKVMNARLIELNSLSKEIKQKDNKLVLQRIPRYMRRRAASHNPKRVPSRYVKHPLTPLANSAVKERRRKQRKKHVNKAKQRLSIKRRNKKEGRTLLHIWFRKRFSLINELDYLVPLRNNTKNYRNLHKATTTQCAFFYRPLIRSLEFKFVDQQQLKEAMVLLKSLLNCSTIDCTHKELDLFFYKDGRCLVPIGLLQPAETSIWLSVPADFYSFLNQKLTKLFSGIQLKFTVYENQYERFRLVGPKSNKYLELLLNNSSTKQPDDVRLTGLFAASNEPTASDQPTASNESTSKAFRVVQNSKFIGNKSPDSVTILVKNQEKRILDVLVSRRLAKRFWYSLIKNKSHLVGGKVDQEYFALQNDLVSYPSVGFLDLPVRRDSNKFKLLKSVLELKFGNGNDQISGEPGDEPGDKTSSIPDHPQVIRTQAFLDLCASPIENADTIVQQYATIDQHSLVNVKLQTVRKGSIEENDLIYLPTGEDLLALKRVANLSKEERFANQLIGDEAPVECVKLKRLRIDDFDDSPALASALSQSSRPVIGVVEIGRFSLRSGCSEAFGTIATGHLIELIHLSRSHALDTLHVLTRSQGSAKFRFCLVSVKQFALF